MVLVSVLEDSTSKKKDSQCAISGLCQQEHRSALPPPSTIVFKIMIRFTTFSQLLLLDFGRVKIEKCIMYGFIGYILLC